MTQAIPYWKSIKMRMNVDLQWLLSPYCTISNEINIASMTLDSRKVIQGTLFVAVQGALLDGRKFIDQSIKAGAVAVLCETKNQSSHGLQVCQNGVFVIKIHQLPHILSGIAYRFYFSSISLHKVIAVTGTNGKTTITSLLANSLMLCGIQSAQMGTIGNGLFGKLVESIVTTPDAISVFEALNNYQAMRCQYTIMEVSSHALVQDRVRAVPFYSAIFTNLTRDHLDYHKTMKAYSAAKKKLFQEFLLTHRIINADDETGFAWLSVFPDAISYGFKRNEKIKTQRYLKITKVAYHVSGLCFSFASTWGKGEISAPFYGDFNVLNLAAVLTQLLVEGIAVKQCEDVFKKLDTVAGRMEQYCFEKKGITFVVDYAHTPDALKNALQTLKRHKSTGRLICVFGCGGDRDKGKRALMATVAEKHADEVVLVDDNPRTESASQIMDDILQGFRAPEKVKTIHCRREAVMGLLTASERGDIVLLAGKGHEKYQIIGREKIEYSDRDLLAKLHSEHQ